MLRMAARLLIALAALCLFADPAWATFPGRNGDLLLTENVNSRAYPANTSNLLRISPRTGALTRTQVCAVTEAGGTPPDSCHWIGAPAASPDGRSVAFSGDTFSGSWYFARPMPMLRALSLDTGTLRYVPLDASRAPSGARVRWMHDLGFALTHDNRRVTLAGPDGSDLGVLLRNASLPDVTRAGRVVFVRHHNLRLRKSDGGTRRLTRNGGDAPSWSPDGRQVAFERGDYVYRLSVRGGGVQRVARGFGPVWSPDGRRIAFLRYAPHADEEAFLYSWSRRTHRVRRLSSESLGVPLPVVRNGLDWAPAR
jgi:hypothetical protein